MCLEIVDIERFDRVRRKHPTDLGVGTEGKDTQVPAPDDQIRLSLFHRIAPAATSNSSTHGRVKLLHRTGQQDVVKLA
jgi:hypothetical protein